MALNSNFRTLTADNIEGLVDNRNYLKSSFENGTIQGWTEMAVTLTSGLPTGTPTISSTAASSIALSATSTTPLSGARSLLVTGAAGWTAGQGFISDEFTLDRMDLGKPLTVTFDYELVSGTLNFSGIRGSQTLMVYIYDATAGAANWIQPAGFLGMNQSSGPGRVTATFQSSVVAGQKYRVAVIASQAVGSACSLEFDNFTCSRVTAPIGPVVTDWQDFPSVAAGTLITSTGTTPSFGTTSVNRARWRRVGDSAEIEWNFAQTTAGTAGTGAYLFNLPAGLVLDSGYTFNTNVSSASTSISAPNVVGSFDANYEAGAAKSIGTGEVIPYSNTRLKVYVGFTTENALTDSEWWGPFYGFNLAPLSMTLRASVKIQGWSSSVQMSNDTDTRVVAFEAKNNTAFAWPGTTYTTINAGWTTTKDTHSGFNSSNGTYTVPVSGYWVFRGGVVMSSLTVAFSTELTIQAGSNEQRIGRYFTQAGSSNTPAVTGTTTPVYCNAGDTVNIRVYSTSAMNLTADVAWNVFGGYRLSGPSVIAASEVVEATYQALAGNVMNNGTEMWLDYGTKIRDTHNAVSGAGSGNKTASNAGWKFTAPITGRYYVNAVFHVTSGAVANSVTYGYIAVNGSAKSHSDIKAGQNPVGDAFGSQINGEVFMNAGDYLEIVGYQANGANRNQQVVNIRNQVEIVRVGAY